MHIKVAHFCTSDVNGGAAQEAYRLHLKLLELGIKSDMIVKYIANPNSINTIELKSNQSIKDRLYQRLNNLKLRKLQNQYQLKRYNPFSWNSYLPNYSIQDQLIEEADIIGMYWIGEFLMPEQICKFKQPIVWKLSDIWPFSGGCHYPGDCTRFHNHCGQCPILNSTNNFDHSYEMISRKFQAYESLDITIAAPSKWIANLASESYLFKNKRIELIKTGIDETKFKPLSRKYMREIFNIPESINLILFGADSASDPRKGFKYLINALKIIKKSNRNDIAVGIFGTKLDRSIYDIGFPIYYFGYTNELYLPAVYNCADVFVAPSLEDNLPNTVLESMGCAVPVCAFNIGGMSDMITHGYNGMLSEKGNSEELAYNILKTIQNSNDFGEKSRNTICNHFTQTMQATSYINLYQSLLKN